MLDTAQIPSPATPADRQDHRHDGPRWLRSAIPLAGAWSLIYAVVCAFWALGGPGLPFGEAGDPSYELSIVGHLDGRSVAAGGAAFGLLGALVALAMHRSGRRAGPAGRIALPAFAWVTAVGLVLLLPDYRMLMAVAYTPLIVLGAPFGWPEGATLAAVYPWPVVNQFVMVAGGLAWTAAAVAHRREVLRACGRCGRAAEPSRWTTPQAAARWGRWAVGAAVAIPLLYAATRWAWALGIPLGISEEFLREGQRTGLWIRGAALATMGIGGAILTLGLAQRWGEVYPRWIPRLGGRRVPPKVAIVPASLVSALVTGAGIMFVRLSVSGFFDTAFGAENWAALAPELLWPAWGVALGAATLAYHYRRRGRCPACGRG